MRETGPVRVGLSGDEDAGRGLIAFARTQLGILKNRMKLGGIGYLTRTLTGANGETIQLTSNMGIDTVRINVPLHAATSITPPAPGAVQQQQAVEQQKRKKKPGRIYLGITIWDQGTGVGKPYVWNDKTGKRALTMPPGETDAWVLGVSRGGRFATGYNGTAPHRGLLWALPADPAKPVAVYADPEPGGAYEFGSWGREFDRISDDGQRVAGLRNADGPAVYVATATYVPAEGEDTPATYTYTDIQIIPYPYAIFDTAFSANCYYFVNTTLLDDDEGPGYVPSIWDVRAGTFLPLSPAEGARENDCTGVSDDGRTVCGYVVRTRAAYPETDDERAAAVAAYRALPGNSRAPYYFDDAARTMWVGSEYRADGPHEYDPPENTPPSLFTAGPYSRIGVAGVTRFFGWFTYQTPVFNTQIRFFGDTTEYSDFATDWTGYAGYPYLDSTFANSPYTFSYARSITEFEISYWINTLLLGDGGTDGEHFWVPWLDGNGNQRTVRYDSSPIVTLVQGDTVGWDALPYKYAPDGEHQVAGYWEDGEFHEVTAFGNGPDDSGDEQMMAVSADGNVMLGLAWQTTGAVRLFVYTKGGAVQELYAPAIPRADPSTPPPVVVLQDEPLRLSSDGTAAVGYVGIDGTQYAILWSSFAEPGRVLYELGPEPDIASINTD